MTTIDFEKMTGAEVEAALAALRKIKKDAADAEKSRYAELFREGVETVLTEHGTTASDYSNRVGVSTQNLTIEIDGSEYTFYVAIKDVKASKKRQEDIDTGKVVLKKKKPATGKSEDKSEEDSEDKSEE